jgi:hypothetical protein
MIDDTTRAGWLRLAVRHLRAPRAERLECARYLSAYRDSYAAGLADHLLDSMEETRATR